VVFSTPIKYAATPELHAHNRLVLPVPIEMVAGRLLREEMQLKTDAGRSMRFTDAVRYYKGGESAGDELFAGSTPHDVVAFREMRSSIFGSSSGIRKGFETTSSYY
jgi:hypothetical protein